MKSRVYIEPLGRSLEAEHGAIVLSLLRDNGIYLDAPCGGNGKCGRCLVSINGNLRRACHSIVEGDSVIVLPESAETGSLSAEPELYEHDGSCIALDIGTTTIVCSYIREGKTVGVRSALNPQRCFGADVVSRLRNQNTEQTRLVRTEVGRLIAELCDPTEVELVSVAANPAMQQIFLGLPVHNLINLPFKPLLTKAEYIPAKDILPELCNAKLLIIPQPAAYVGADTLSCVMSAKLYDADKPCLLMDIGTNAELIIGCRDKLICTSTAAGPALEGADISCGMRAERGAIDRVSVSDGNLSAHIVGDVAARGICGSGVIDAVAALLDTGRIDRRGRIIPKTDDRVIICGDVYLTQEDIRRVQSAKAAICGGILTLLSEYGIGLSDIDRVYIAGTFGNYIDIRSACRIGLLPSELQSKASAIGNAAQRGAAELALDSELFMLSETVASKMQSIELGGSAFFRRAFAEKMYFKE